MYLSSTRFVPIASPQSPIKRVEVVQADGSVKQEYARTEDMSIQQPIRVYQSAASPESGRIALPNPPPSLNPTTAVPAYASPPVYASTPPIASPVFIPSGQPSSAALTSSALPTQTFWEKYGMAIAIVAAAAVPVILQTLMKPKRRSKYDV